MITPNMAGKIVWRKRGLDCIVQVIGSKPPYPTPTIKATGNQIITVGLIRDNVEQRTWDHWDDSVRDSYKRPKKVHIDRP